MNKLLFFLFIFIILLSLTGLKTLNKFLKFAPNRIVIVSTYVGIVINFCISLFIFTVFRNTALLEGPPGPIGDAGIKGPAGFPDSCIKCETTPVTLGDKRIEFVKENNLIVPIPQIDNT